MGTKKLHSISEVKFSRSSTPFDKDPHLPLKLFQVIPIMEGDHHEYKKSDDLQIIANHPVS